MTSSTRTGQIFYYDSENAFRGPNTESQVQSWYKSGCFRSDTQFLIYRRDGTEVRKTLGELCELYGCATPFSLARRDSEDLSVAVRKEMRRVKKLLESVTGEGECIREKLELFDASTSEILKRMSDGGGRGEEKKDGKGDEKDGCLFTLPPMPKDHPLMSVRPLGDRQSVTMAQAREQIEALFAVTDFDRLHFAFTPHFKWNCPICSDGSVAMIFVHGCRMYFTHLLTAGHIKKLKSKGGCVTQQCVDFYVDILSRFPLKVAPPPPPPPQHRPVQVVEPMIAREDAKTSADSVDVSSLSCAVARLSLKENVPFVTVNPKDDSKEADAAELYAIRRMISEKSVDLAALNSYFRKNIPFDRCPLCPDAVACGTKFADVFVFHILTEQHLAKYKARGGRVTAECVRLWTELLERFPLEQALAPTPGPSSFTEDCDENACSSNNILLSAGFRPPQHWPLFEIDPKGCSIDKGYFITSEQHPMLHSFRSYLLNVNCNAAEEHLRPLIQLSHCAWCGTELSDVGIQLLLAHAVSKVHIKKFVAAGGFVCIADIVFYFRLLQLFEHELPEDRRNCWLQAAKSIDIVRLRRHRSTTVWIGNRPWPLVAAASGLQPSTLTPQEVAFMQKKQYVDYLLSLQKSLADVDMEALCEEQGTYFCWWECAVCGIGFEPGVLDVALEHYLSTAHIEALIAAGGCVTSIALNFYRNLLAPFLYEAYVQRDKRVGDPFEKHYSQLLLQYLAKPAENERPEVVSSSTTGAASASSSNAVQASPSDVSAPPSSSKPSSTDAIEPERQAPPNAPSTSRTFAKTEPVCQPPTSSSPVSPCYQPPPPPTRTVTIPPIFGGGTVTLTAEDDAAAYYANTSSSVRQVNAQRLAQRRQAREAAGSERSKKDKCTTQ